MQKHIRSKKHSENDKQIELNMPDWLFREEVAPIKNKIKKVYKPNPSEQLAEKTI